MHRTSGSGPQQFRSRHPLLGTLLVLAGFLALPASARAGDADPLLKGQLDQLVKDSKPIASDVGVFVEDLDDGSTLYEHKADTPFNPASVTKIVTTETALEVLGPGHLFRTHVLASGAVEKGTLHGDLVIYGEGDPSITLERLWRIASLIKVAGVNDVSGNIVVDDSFFDDVRSGAGYDDFDDDKAYTAPIGAVSATWNTVAVWVKPGDKPGSPALVSLDPPTSFVKVVNHATTASSGSRRRIDVTIKDRVITVNGAIPLWQPAKAWYRPIDDPPAYFATLLKEYLAQQGVTVRGAYVHGPTPAGATELFAFESEPLGVIVRDLNKYSNNFTAEQILKAVGAAKYGAPGSAQKGLDAIGEHLLALGVPPGSWSIKNGSGLNRDNKVSPRVFGKVLEAAYNDFKVRGDFVASLGIAGEDGTLVHRMIGTPGAGTVRGKTGTVDGSTCLAGYVLASNGHVLAFSILMNGVSGRTFAAHLAQDKIAISLAQWGATGPAAASLPSTTTTSTLTKTAETKTQ